MIKNWQWLQTLCLPRTDHGAALKKKFKKKNVCGSYFSATSQEPTFPPRPGELLGSGEGSLFFFLSSLFASALQGIW